MVEPALDRLRASPAPGGGPFAQAHARTSWMREPARESASPMSRHQAPVPGGPAPDGRSMSRQPSGSLLLPPMPWRSSTPAARGREPRRLYSLSMESVSASAAGSPGIRASNSPPPASAAANQETAPSLQMLPPALPASVSRRQRPPRAADVTAAAREAAADALEARFPSRESCAPEATAAQPITEQLATVDECGPEDGMTTAVRPRGKTSSEAKQGRQWIGILRDAAGMWQITLKVRLVECLARVPAAGRLDGQAFCCIRSWETMCRRRLSSRNKRGTLSRVSLL